MTQKAKYVLNNIPNEIDSDRSLFVSVDDNYHIGIDFKDRIRFDTFQEGKTYYIKSKRYGCTFYGPLGSFGWNYYHGNSFNNNFIHRSYAVIKITSHTKEELKQISKLGELS